jgi:hypothetical protein
MSETTIIKNNVLSDKSDVLNLNNTLNIIKTASSGSSGHNTSALQLKDRSSSGTIKYGQIFVNTVGSDTDLYFQPDSEVSTNALLLHKNNIESEFESIYSDKSLNVNSLVVGTDSSSSDVYINLINENNTNEGENGAGFKLVHSTGKLQFKSIGESWDNISGLETTLESLGDTNITSVADNQLLIYHNSSSKWINTNNVSIPGTLSIGGNLTIGSNYLVFNNEHGLVDSVGNELINLKGNTSSKNTVNYLQIENADSGAEPKLLVKGSDTNVGIDINTKGTGDVTLTSPSGNVVVSGTNIDIGGYIKSSIYTTSSNSSYAPDQFWSIPISSDTILFDFIEDNTAGTYYANITAGIHGQKINLIYNNSGSKSITILSDFESDNLITGSGLSTKLKFMSTGQSAYLIYLGHPINKWQVINSGAIALS